MLYFRSLYEGLSALPSADKAVRQRLEQRAEEQGWAALHARLAEVDPESAERIHPNDPQRTLRALEVYEVSGIPLSEHFRQQEKTEFPYRVSHLAMAPPERSRLHQRIEQRFHHMLELGFVAEVEVLYARGDLTPDMPSMRSVGYRQVLKYLMGDLTYEDMVEKGIIATRQLAKRQMTWLRSQKPLTWFDAEDKRLIDKVYSELLEAQVFQAG